MAKREFGVIAQMRTARKALKQPVITSMKVMGMPHIMFQEVLFRICRSHAPDIRRDSWLRRDLALFGVFHG